VTAYFFLTPHASRLLLVLLPTGNWQLPTSSSRLMPHAFFCLLPTGNCQLLPHASCLMPSSAYWRLATADFTLRFANLKTSATPQKKAHHWQASFQ